MEFPPILAEIKPIVARIFAYCVLGALVLQVAGAQTRHAVAAKRDKGPRAVGLLEIAPNGKAHLIPVTIMVDGKFYDAASYKASPVPMALDSGTVYEGFRSGVSQGLFTVSGALEGKGTWRGEGTWQTKAEIDAAAARKKAAQSARAKKKVDDVEGPPVLRRANSSKSGTQPSASQASTSAPASPPESDDPDRPTLKRAGTPPSATAGTPPSATAGTPAPAASDSSDDPERPRLSREIPAVKASKAENATPTHAKISAPTTLSSSSAIQLVPAISDAAGPDPVPYNFVMKNDEERQLRNKMLALAADEINVRRNPVVPDTAPAPKSVGKSAKKKSKAPMPNFEDVHLRVFDLSNSNEPVLVLTAKCPPPTLSSAKPQSPKQPAANAKNPGDEYLITLVAREDIYGDLHKALSNITDAQHLDVMPRLDLIDAVDVDGDGRGELLFRRVSDTGSAYVVYRVIGNQLWALFEGATT